MKLRQNLALNRDMFLSKGDAFFFALMAGAGEGYLVAFALEVGMNPIYAGLLATLPLFFGGVFQFFINNWVEKKESYHRFVHIGSFLQALSFLPFALFALFKFHNFFIFLFVGSLYWMLAFSIGASWNVLISCIIPFPKRNSFFSQRSTFTYSGMFLGMIFSGIILELGNKNQQLLNCFAVIFLFSMLARMISASFLKKHSNVLCQIEHKDGFSWDHLKLLLQTGPLKRILIFVVLFKIPIYLAAPFFIPYMLKEIRMNYLAFMIVLSASLVGKILISRKLDWLAAKISMRRLLLLSGFGIAVVPILWIVSGNVIYLIILQIISGMAWGGFEYSFFLTILNELPRQEQARFMSVYNFFNASAIIVGSLVGAGIFSMKLFGFNHYFVIFVISGVFRLLTLFLFPQVMHKILELQWKLVLRPFSFRPNQGQVERPLIFKVKAD